MTHTEIKALVTKTSADTGADVDVSALTGDWTLVLEVIKQAQSDGASRFVFEDSADSGSNHLGGPSASVYGPLGTSANSTPANFPTPDTKRYTWTKKDFPSLRLGATNDTLRLKLAEITGTSPSVTYHAWLETA